MIHKHSLILAVLSGLVALSEAFFLKPSIYKGQVKSSGPTGTSSLSAIHWGGKEDTQTYSEMTNKIVCQNDWKDALNRAYTYGEHFPYLECTNDNYLTISKAHLITTNEELCPLQYAHYNEEQECDVTSILQNYDVTDVMHELCEGKNKCVFSWEELPRLACVQSSSDSYSYSNSYSKDSYKIIDHDNQAIKVAYACISKRPQMRPFGNKRYNHKFHRDLAHPLRKLSYNRLVELDGPAIRRPPMPLPIPMPMPIGIPQPSY